MDGTLVPSGPASAGDPPPPLLLVDGFNLLWGATFGFPAEIRSRDKTRLLTGLFGFFALLRVAVRENFPAAPEVIVVFDGQDGGADRRDVDAAYKAQRPTDQAALAPIEFLTDVKRGLDHHNIVWVELQNAEADDVIATLAAATLAPRQVVIMSKDRDFYQLITSQVRVLNTKMHPGKRFIGPDDVYERHQVTPAQWADYRALTGDPADNIPGIAGIGAKTAATLLRDGLTLDDLPDSGRLQAGKGRHLSENFDLAKKWRHMIRLNDQMDIPVESTGCASNPLPAPADVIDALNLW